MNIFILDKDPKKAARQHCDKHVVKMISECRQMMRFAHIKNPTKRGYINHPCSVWVRSTIDNYCWVYDLAEGLNEEYKRRYSKSEDHKSWQTIKSWEMPEIPTTGLTSFALAMPEQYQDPTDPVGSYREYYINDKQDFATWRKTERPHWWRVL